MNILEDFYKPAVLSPDHSYSDSGIYHQIQPTYDLNVRPHPRTEQEGTYQAGAPGCHEHLDGDRKKSPCPSGAPFHFMGTEVE